MLHDELNKLNEKLVKMAGLTRSMVDRSILALQERDEKLAREILEVDEVAVNQLEIDNLEDSIKVIARFQPTATDLRMLIAGIFINRDLERIADHAENIAEFAIFFSKLANIKTPPYLVKMAQMGMKMLDESIQALLNGDEELAKRVIAEDSQMNALTDKVVGELVGEMAGDIQTTEQGLKLILVARNLERIADMTTNIAESVLFVVESKIYLHRKKDVAKELEEDKGK